MSEGPSSTEAIPSNPLHSVLRSGRLEVNGIVDSETSWVVNQLPDAAGGRAHIS
jgi:hypothetical protein